LHRSTVQSPDGNAKRLRAEQAELRPPSALISRGILGWAVSWEGEVERL
jgi:hypothetical protein